MSGKQAKRERQAQRLIGILPNCDTDRLESTKRYQAKCEFEAQQAAFRKAVWDKARDRQEAYERVCEQQRYAWSIHPDNPERVVIH